MFECTLPRTACLFTTWLVVHLAQLAKHFQSERIDLLVLDQNIDTSTSTGRLMFNMLASIAEFENDLRSERQAEGIAKAKEQLKIGKIVIYLKIRIQERPDFRKIEGDIPV